MSDIEVPNLDHDPRYNREGGRVISQGSAEQIEMAKFEQFPHSKWAFGNPGNPYKFRRYPAMMYRAETRNGKTMCMEPEPQSWEFQTERNYIHAMEGARAFTLKCQRTVNSDEEWSRAMNEGFRDDPVEAVKAFEAKANAVAQTYAHETHEDRNMSEAAKAEKVAAEDEAGAIVVGMPEKRLVRKRKTA